MLTELPQAQKAFHFHGDPECDLCPFHRIISHHVFILPVFRGWQNVSPPSHLLMISVTLFSGVPQGSVVYRRSSLHVLRTVEVS